MPPLKKSVFFNLEYQLFPCLKKSKKGDKIELGKKGINRIFANYLENLTLNPTSLWNKR